MPNDNSTISILCFHTMLWLIYITRMGIGIFLFWQSAFFSKKIYTPITKHTYHAFTRHIFLFYVKRNTKKKRRVMHVIVFLLFGCMLIPFDYFSFCPSGTTSVVVAQQYRFFIFCSLFTTLYTIDLYSNKA